MQAAIKLKHFPKPAEVIELGGSIHSFYHSHQEKINVLMGQLFPDRHIGPTQERFLEMYPEIAEDQGWEK